MDSPIRVAHLIQYFEVGGIERMVHGIAAGVTSQGVASLVIAYLHDGAFRQSFESDGISTVFLPTRPGIQLALPLRIAAELRRCRIQVLHSHHLGPFLYGGLAARLTRIPHVHTEHSVELYDTPRRRIVGRLMPAFARVVSVAPEVAEWRRGELGSSSAVIPNGVAIPSPPSDDEAAAARGRLGVERGAFTIGCVARLSPEKDHATLVSAFRRVSDSVQGAVLLLAGEGAERRRIEARVTAAGLNGRVRFLGQIDDLADVWLASDVIALSSTREGLPLSLLEGMAYARPAVATAVGGIPGLIASSGGGAVAPASSPEALAAALVRYAREPQRRLDDGAAARRYVAEHHSRETMIARYVALYRECLRP